MKLATVIKLMETIAMRVRSETKLKTNSVFLVTVSTRFKKFSKLNNITITAWQMQSALAGGIIMRVHMSLR